MTDHLEPVFGGHDEGLADRSSDLVESEPFDLVARPIWWRWVAAVVIAALVLATPFAYAIDRIWG